MATKKKTSSKRSSSGSDPKSKRIVRKKMQKTMHEFKHHELKSGPGGKAGKVKNPKQAIAIGLSEARQSGAKIPKKGARKKSTTKKSSGRKSTSKKTARRR
jgi:Family of unknown function (DUF6496)